MDPAQLTGMPFDAPNRLLSTSIATLVAATAVLCAPSSAAAQAEGFTVDRFAPQPARSLNYNGVATPRALSLWSWELGVLGSLSDDLLVQDDTAGDRLRAVIHREASAHVHGALGLSDHVDVGFVLPVLAWRDAADDVAPGLSSPAGVHLGDLRLVSHVTLVGVDTRWAHGLVLEASAPTGDSEALAGGGPQAAVTWATEFGRPSESRIAINLGYRWLSQTGTLDNLVIDDHLTWGIARDVPLTGAIHAVPELGGTIPATTDAQDADHLTTELRVGAKWIPSRGPGYEGGIATGLVPGAGSPDWRVYLGTGVAWTPNPDRDGDGILNRSDDCPREPEDIDGFEDEDGCPDLDNDGDGILDVDDACPNMAEDFDGWEDEDGCPDLDNDGDGILDEDDACPDVAEDPDGWEDEDGCPDRDNDDDGYPDTEDECPNWPEDFDDFEDEDGCPDLDNDNDGIPDDADMCPNDAEVLNDVDDEDGCPDEGGEFELTCDGVELDSIYFVFDSAEIQEVSLPTLDRVANILRNAPYINHMRIEGHTDSQGPADYNMQLSTDRAESVVDYLVSQGIAQERLSWEGFGETRPIADEGTWQGRYHNRRVGFIIIDQDRCREER